MNAILSLTTEERRVLAALIRIRAPWQQLT